MALSQSRCGIHYLGRGPEQSLLDAGMRLSKWVNSDPPANLPSGFLAIWRWVELPDSINDKMGGNPEDAAREWINKQWTHILFVPGTVYIEGPNENNCENPQQAVWFNRFELERMRLMELRGYKCCIGNFGTGRPSRPNADAGGVVIWTALLPMLRYAKSHGHILGMHAYHYDPHDIYHNLRYRPVYSWLPLDAQPNLVITEWGLDGTKGRFRDASWRSQYSDPDTEYLNIIKAYDAELSRDDYVLGFTIYTDGTNNSDAWKPFDIAGQPLIPKLAGYLRSLGDTPVTNFFVNQNVKVVHPAGANFRSPDATSSVTGHVTPRTVGRITAGPYTGAKVPRWKVSWGGWTGEDVFVDANKRLFPPVVNVTGRVNSPPHRTMHGYRSIRPLDLGTPPDPHWTGIQDVWGQFNFDRIEWVDGTWYLLITDGKGNWGGSMWMPWRETREGEELIANVALNGPGPDWMDFPDPGAIIIIPPDDPPPDDPPPPPPMTGVQLFNGGFEGGVHAAPPGVSGLLPEGWELVFWATSSTPRVEHQDSPWAAPEVMVNSDTQLTSDLLPLPEGHKVLHGFLGWRPMWFRIASLAHKLHLKPGDAVLSAQLFFDPVATYSPKVYGGDPITCEFRMGFVELDGQPLGSTRSFVNGSTIPFGHWRKVDFGTSIHVEGDYIPYLEYRGRFGMTHNGFFVDDLRIDTDGIVEPPPPTHRVWSQFTLAEKDALIEALRTQTGV